ncbi:MAG: putative O-linked N-acetylglucosamine transferase, family [Myxococcales bacterium]|nr:putative O-linked N-acetylglucosamine transferase, family [Myxococcales bacterium]
MQAPGKGGRSRPPLDTDAVRERARRHARDGQRADAERLFRQLVHADPEDAEALNDLGVILSESESGDDAIEAFLAAFRARPGWAAPLINLGTALRNRARFEEAIDAYRHALRLDPSNPSLHHHLGSVLGRVGLRAAASQHYFEALRLDPSDGVVHSGLLYLMAFDPDLAPAASLTEHLWWDRLHGRGMVTNEGHGNRRDPTRRLRVGYFSPDFRAHAVAGFTLPVLSAHDRREFEVFIYAHVQKTDDLSERFRGLSDTWRITHGLSDDAIAALVRADGIDLLVDLAGHTTGGRPQVFTRQPAPLQVSYLGYPCTTGLAENMQGRLTDAIIDPPGDVPQYTEELLRLPGAWSCWEPPAAPDVAPAPCLAAGFVTFGSMANLLKLNDGVLDLWAEVLRAVPNARLRVFRNTLDGLPRDLLARKLVERGLARERFDLETTAADGVGHLRDYAKIDIALDTQPWSGHTTTCEALWMGVPLLTLRGARPAGRMAASVLTAAGLPELVAETPAAFVALARAHAGAPEGLAALRASLRERVRRSALCDGITFTRGLEAAYRALWRRWCEALP